MHFMIQKPGYRTLVSQIFDGSSTYLDNDSVFAVKDDLIAEFVPTLDADTNLHVQFDFALKREKVLVDA
jgi:catechol 1,2-dioxygenase